MRTAVLGAGGVGGYFGARLARAGEDVTLIARGPHLEALRSQGLFIRSFQGDFHVTVPAVAHPQDMRGPVDLVLFCVKSYDTEQGIESIRALMNHNPRAYVLCLQNGVNNELKLSDAFGADRVLGGVVYIGAEIEAPGIIRHESRGEIVLGPWTAQQGEIVGQVAEVFSRAGVPVRVVEDIRAAKWQKFLFNCGLNATTAITGQRLGVLMSVPEARAFFRRVVEESAAVGRAEGISLPQDAVDQVMAIAETMDIRSSMQADFERGRPLELDSFNGYVLELGRQHGIDTPANEALYALLKAATAVAPTGLSS